MMRDSRRSKVQERIAPVCRNAEQGCKCRDDRSQIAALAGEKGLELLQPHSGTVLALEPSRVLEAGNDGVQGTAYVLRRALEEQSGVQIIAELLPQSRGGPRLADTRLAHEQHELAFAFASQLPTFEKQCDLVLAADKGRQTRCL